MSKLNDDNSRYKDNRYKDNRYKDSRYKDNMYKDNRYEEKLLTMLVEGFRSSVKDSGGQKVSRRTSLKPEKLYRKYHANDGSYDEIEAIDAAAQALAEMGFIYCEREKFGTRITKIYFVDEKIEEAEEYLHLRYGYVTKDMELDCLRNLINSYEKASPACAAECEKLRSLAEKRKVPANYSDLEDIFKAAAFIENNSQDLYLREVSMKVYGNSKYFEENTLKPVCALLRKYADKRETPGDQNNHPVRSDSPDRSKAEDQSFISQTGNSITGQTSGQIADSDDMTGNNTASDTYDRSWEMADEILSRYHITREPGKLSLKGNCLIFFGDRCVDAGALEGGLEIRASELSRITGICVQTSKFMTIENRTSYLRYHDPDTVTFYLGGYADRNQRDFLKLVFTQNPCIQYLHFGDIDAGGLYILQNLRGITGIPFAMFHMSPEDLQDERFKSCLLPLTDHDRKRLEKLRDIPDLQDTVFCMLACGKKLEQEIVSLALMDRI